MGVVKTAQELAWNTTISEIKMHQDNIVPIKWLDANKLNLIQWLEYVQMCHPEPVHH
jgi:hypothetical protein